MTIEMNLPPKLCADRHFVETAMGGPCFRFWMTRPEFEMVCPDDVFAYELTNGRMAVWRLNSALAGLQDETALRQMHARLLVDREAKPRGRK